LRPREEIFTPDVGLIPSALVWSNYTDALRALPFLSWAANTGVILVFAVAITVFINLLCGYAFAKFRFAGRNILFMSILSTLMIPIQVIIVPLFLIVAQLGLLNDYWGVILPRAAEAFGIFMVRQFMVGIPDELIRGRAHRWRLGARNLPQGRGAAVETDHRGAHHLHRDVALETTSRCRSSS
jgi:ABC-type glycerol-3-phosphate transport system permease component